MSDKDIDSEMYSKLSAHAKEWFLDPIKPYNHTKFKKRIDVIKDYKVCEPRGE